MKLESDDTHPFILSDTYRFKQVLANILSNALKYGRSSVIVTLESDENAVTICIEDDKISGIEDKHIVFELYEQSKQGLSNMEKRNGNRIEFCQTLCEDLKFEYRLEDSSRLGRNTICIAHFIQGGSSWLEYLSWTITITIV